MDVTRASSQSASNFNADSNATSHTMYTPISHAIRSMHPRGKHRPSDAIADSAATRQQPSALATHFSHLHNHTLRTFITDANQQQHTAQTIPSHIKQQLRKMHHQPLHRNATDVPQTHRWIAHMDDFAAFGDDHDDGMTFDKAMIAGASAGVSEHIVMFPVDTIKTRLQAQSTPTAFSGAAAPQPKYRNVFQAGSTIIREEGFLRLYRGIPATVAGAIPSHAVHYGTYEYLKERFGGNLPGHHLVATSSAGALATMTHDAIVTPLDVVKQRMQLCNSPYRSITHCVQSIIREEGFRAFYASYPTTVLMNVPFMAVHFGSYESFKLAFTNLANKDEKDHGPAEEIVAGGLSGAAAGLLSNPIDVIKTRIQTQSVAFSTAATAAFHGDTPATVVTHGCPSCAAQIPHASHNTNLLNARQIASSIYRQEGWRGFMRGASARVVYFIPSAAICWTTYETFKRILKDAW